MTSITSNRQREQYNKSNFNDENISDDSLLLMADDFEDKAPLLNIIDEDFIRANPVLSNDIPLRLRSSISHCHVSDEKFDYGARNRLIIVLILCIIFMIIEIIGMFVCFDFYKKKHRSYLPRWNTFKFNSCNN
jgi:hypothetical protein